MIHGGQIVARALKAEGVDAVFTLTGGHIVGILDGCVQEGIRVVDVRHEQAAAHAAEAYGRLTGTLGVALVTAGPGVTDAITAVASAWQANAPMLLIGGRHLIRQETKGGLQEMDHPRLFGSITAWAGTAWETERLAEHVAVAARHAFAGRGAPVFLDIPLDVQFGTVEESAVAWPSHYRAAAPAGADAAIVETVAGLLAAAERPMVFAGGGLRDCRVLADLVEPAQAPTYLNSRARGSLSYGHPLLGNYARSASFAGADLVLALGVDWDFRTGYGGKIGEAATVVQVDADATKIGWNRPAHHGVVADPAAFVAQLAGLSDRYAVTGERAWAAEITAAERARRAEADCEAASADSPVHPQRFARDVADFFGPESIVSVDGGDIVSTTARWMQTSTPGHLLDPGPFGTLGTGAPFAIAAKVAFPDKLVGIVYGDGAFGFNGMEYDTLVRLDLPVVGVVGNDGVWSNIKTFHRSFFPDRLVATDLGVRPYHDMVSALGGYGEFVDRPEGIRPALERARASGKPALVNVHIAETMRASSNYAG